MASKEQERSELHRTIWQIANNLRGSIDGWDFKQYVLGILFYRFISENLTNYINDDERRSGKKDFDYSKLSDKEAEFGRSDTVKEKGFYILPSELFRNVTAKARNDPNLNETLSVVFKNIENSAKGTESEDDLKGLFDDLDVNSNKLGNTVEQRNKQLVKLLDSISELRLGNYSDNTIDAFGDVIRIISHCPRTGNPKQGGTGKLISTEHCFTLDRTPHIVDTAQSSSRILDCYNKKVHTDRTPALTEPHHNSIRLQEPNSRIRKLTPIECERLQGFPEGWTEGVSDTQRYKQLGNAVTTNVIKEIILKLKKD